MQQQMYSPASSPGPSYSDRAVSPKKAGFFDSIKRALPAGGRPESPASSFGGSILGSEAGAGTPKSRMFPSFSNGQRKRDIIKKLKEEMSLMQLQVRQQESTIAKLQQQLQQEQAARIDAQERLNMQHFKANLLADMMVLKLLDIEQQGQDTQPAALKVKQQAQGLRYDQQQQQQQQYSAGQQQQQAAQGGRPAGQQQQGGLAAAGVLEESSFE
uniref:Uncharacterized protein n=1 Tax=Tetradesmus obliquus TaxID=3088 RepID=A0A383V8G3_TETOB|eukprot:jgi/Sobl393_1/1787/SZX60874.1